MTARLPQPLRLREGGLINRNRPITFTFDRRVYQGYEGDSLASALLASGVKLFGRSFKYHRPRGVFSAGPEEPSASRESPGCARLPSMILSRSTMPTQKPARS